MECVIFVLEIDTTTYSTGVYTMKRLENGNLFSIEIFNGNLFNTEDRTRNISFEKKLRVFSEDYINEKNPVAQDVILKDSV